MTSKQNDNMDANFPIEIAQVELSDLPAVKGLLTYWMDYGAGPDFEEINASVAKVEAALNGQPDSGYFVAKENGAVVGFIGFYKPEEKMTKHAKTAKPIELVNFFMKPEYRAKGIGKRLFNTLIETVKQKGYSEVILNSGVKFGSTGGWGFYNRKMEYVGQVENFYNDRYPTRIWRLDL